MRTNHLAFPIMGAAAVAIFAAGGYLVLDSRGVNADSQSPDRLSNAAIPTVSYRALQTQPSEGRAGLQIEDFSAAGNAHEEVTSLVQTLRSRGASHDAIRRQVTLKNSEYFAEKRRAVASIDVPDERAAFEKQRRMSEVSLAEQRSLRAVLRRHRLDAVPANDSASLIESAQTASRSTPDGLSSALASTGFEGGIEKQAVPPAAMSPLAEQNSTEWQIAERQRLENDFIESIGGRNQSPSDADYYARWQTAQQRSDALFRQKFGTAAFLKHNMEAWRTNAH